MSCGYLIWYKRYHWLGHNNTKTIDQISTFNSNYLCLGTQKIKNGYTKKYHILTS